MSPPLESAITFCLGAFCLGFLTWWRSRLAGAVEESMRLMSVWAVPEPKSTFEEQSAPDTSAGAAAETSAPTKFGEAPTLVGDRRNSVNRKQSRGAETALASPSYLRAALLNQYNVILLGGSASFSAALASWVPVLSGLVGEAIWLVTGPRLKSFKRYTDAAHAPVHVAVPGYLRAAL
jgi:hypothetical protein